MISPKIVFRNAQLLIKLMGQTQLEDAFKCVLLINLPKMTQECVSLTALITLLLMQTSEYVLLCVLPLLISMEIQLIIHVYILVHQILIFMLKTVLDCAFLHVFSISLPSLIGWHADVCLHALFLTSHTLTIIREDAKRTVPITPASVFWPMLITLPWLVWLFVQPYLNTMLISQLELVYACLCVRTRQFLRYLLTILLEFVSPYVI